MPNKQLGYIYKIQHKTRTDTPIYFGSTSNLEKREKNHKYSCCNPIYKKHNYYVYQFIRDFGGWDNWELKKLNEILYDDKKELKNLERLYIENHQNSGFKTLNHTIPNRTKKEWIRDNPDKIKNILQQSRLRNREKANEYRRKQYYKNKETILKQNKEYYQKNKEKINSARRLKWRCLCGAEVSLRQRSQHLKTKFHHEHSLINLNNAITCTTIKNNL